jgi:peptidoglycan-associated lipoprotein
MIPIHRGRGGSVTRTAEVTRIVAAGLICFALGVAGCSSKKTQNMEGLPNGGAQTGSDLTQKNTLEDYSKTGQLGGGTNGPLTDIHFGYNDYTVQPQDSSILRTNATWLQDHPGTNVQVEGNCDERGSEEYNIALGAKRAQSAKDYLTTLGISPSRISTISYGKELPICHESDESCWQQNRRDHFVVSGNQAGR